MEEELILSIVFKGLARTPTLWGVDYNYFILNCLAVLLVFINTQHVLSLLVFIPLHFVGWLLCKIDPHIFKLISVRATIGATKNKSLWNCQSYEAF